MPKINPRIMTWARESAGLSLSDAARAIGLSGANAVTRLEEMEAGQRDPSRRQLVEWRKNIGGRS
jgi:transcriptional regulator with XRE-family HTH domain